MRSDTEPWEIEGLQPATEEQWRASVNAVLARRRGELSADELERLFTRVLTTATDDDIVLQPLYRAGDAPADQGLPGQAPFIRGATSAGGVPSGWDVRQRVCLAGDAEQARHVVATELANGASSVWLDLDGHHASTDLLDEVLSDADLATVAVALASGPAATEAASALQQLWRRRGVSGRDASGSLGFDPVGRFATSGGVEDAGIGMAAAAEAAMQSHSDHPNVSTLVADGVPYHDAGASEADELALALATGTEYLRTLRTAGMSVADALGQVDVRLAATDNQFLTIAKLRAARRLFARVAELAGADNARSQRVHAVSSHAMLTRYDPWVNLLRTTVAGFAAGVAGADSVTVEPHDLRLRTERSGETTSTRLARNIQAILIDEAHLARVLDPAGGSWFVERLTDDLAQAAWSRFQALEAADGIVTALHQGVPQEWIAQTRAARADRIAHRRQPLTGVTEFPNLADSPDPEPQLSTGPTPFVAVAPHYYAENVERLRDRALAHARRTGQAPTVFLATLGPLAEHTARATFTANLFAVGGVVAIHPGTMDAGTVGSAFAASGARLACICGSDSRYTDEAVDVAAALSAHQPARLYLAGNPGSLRADLDAAGVQEYVVAGCDAVDLVDRALTTVGVPA